MKAWYWIPLALIVAVPIVRFILQRLRESRAQKNGVAVYGTMVSLEPVKVFGKLSQVVKVNLWVQEPGAERRAVSMTSRIPEGQKVEAGMMLPVVIDPTDPRRVYPASADALKRMQLTGSREMRRRMKKQKM
jgi:hypothetical protein